MIDDMIDRFMSTLDRMVHQAGCKVRSEEKKHRGVKIHDSLYDGSIKRTEKKLYSGKAEKKAMKRCRVKLLKEKNKVNIISVKEE
jgi:hypothetical protein